MKPHEKTFEESDSSTKNNNNRRVSCIKHKRVYQTQPGLFNHQDMNSEQKDRILQLNTDENDETRIKRTKPGSKDQKKDGFLILI